MINLREAADRIGARVTYHYNGVPSEKGTILSISPQGHLMVHYDGDTIAKATPPDALDYVHETLSGYIRQHKDGTPDRCTNPNCSRSHIYQVRCTCHLPWRGRTLKQARQRRDEHIDQAVTAAMTAARP